MSTKVILCCANGFTTMMLCKKIREEASNQGLDYEVNACPISELSTFAKDANIILLGPQVRFNLSKVKGEYPNIPVALVDSQALAFTDGAAVLKQIKKELGE